MASGIGEVRLFHNNVNAIPVGVYEDITSSFTVGATSGTGGLTKGGLDPGTQYWFWVELIDVAGNASAILPLGSITTASSEPAPVPSTATESLVVTSLATMAAGSVAPSTPFASLANLPDFLVGVPMSKSINSPDTTFSFDSGGVHVYGFRSSIWKTDQPGTTTVYNGTKYDGPGGSGYLIDQIVHIYFADASFTLNRRSYIWFFTRTPPSEATAIFNA